jgi:uncharacterized surface protein with fasciclin (FAS1) repeats
MKANHDLIDTAKRAGNFQVFTKAVAQAGLEETLREMGPYTIFAPTDHAFARVPKAEFERLFKPQNKESLQFLLRNHIVPGKFMIRDLKNLDKTMNAKGEEMNIESRSGVWVNEAKILSADLEASNGVLHGIETVLAPLGQVATAD